MRRSVVWLHTFSPAKMWINGLTHPQQAAAAVPYAVQRALPWDSIDMDFMNLNQTAHGGREFGFIGARMRQQHSVVTGHWQDKEPTSASAAGCARRSPNRIPAI
jgi:L-arabinose isomerase